MTISMEGGHELRETQGQVSEMWLVIYATPLRPSVLKKDDDIYMKNKKIWNASRICVSSLRRGHANLLCIVPILICESVARFE